MFGDLSKPQNWHYKEDYKIARKAILKTIPSNARLFVFEEEKMCVAVQQMGREFFRISASYCSEYDKFSKKTGKAIALQRLLDGQYVSVKFTAYSLPGHKLALESACRQAADEFVGIFS